MKFYIKDFLSKILNVKLHFFLRIWSHLLKKFLIENLFFCAGVVVFEEKIASRMARTRVRQETIVSEQVTVPGNEKFLGVKVDFTLVPPNMVLPNNIKDSPGKTDEGRTTLLQQDTWFERQPEFVT